MSGSGYNLIEMTEVDQTEPEEEIEDEDVEKNEDNTVELDVDDIAVVIKNGDGDSKDRPFSALASPSRYSLYKASREGDYSSLESYLRNVKTKARINHLDERQCTPLHYAARYSHVKIVELLLDHGAFVDRKGSDGMTPFHYACRYGKNGSVESPSNQEFGGANVEVLKILQSHGANISHADNYGLTGLHHACMRGNLQVVQYLVAPKDWKFIHQKDLQGSTALHIASTYGHQDIVAYLIEQGADPKLTCKQGQSIVHRAAEGGHYEVMQVLVALDDFPELANKKEIRGLTVLHLAIDCGAEDVLKLLLENGLENQVNIADAEEEMPLHSAARIGQANVVSLLLEHGATLHIDAKNGLQQTALHLAAENGHYKIVKKLLKYGADYTKIDRDACTPFLLAAIEGYQEIMNELLNAGADLDQVDKNDHNVLHLLAQHNQHSILQSLVEEHDCQKLINSNDQFDEIPLHIAAKYGHVESVNILLEHGADIDNKNEDEQSPCHLAASEGHPQVIEAILKKDPFCINDRDEDDNTPLHIAAKFKQSDCMKVLLDNNSKTQDRNNKSWTPLDCAAAAGCLRCVMILLDYDSPVDPVDRKNTTPLHLAAEFGHDKIVDLLLSKGADINILDTEGCNALEIAIIKNRRSVAETILMSPVWKDALRSTSNYKDERGDLCPNTPLRMLIRTFPDLVEKVFDRCITTKMQKNGLNKMRIDVEFVDDAYHYQEVEEGGGQQFEYARIDEDDAVVPFEEPYHQNAAVRMENHPLLIMVKCKANNLLRHPLSIALARQKWKSFGRYVFYTQLLMYILYLASITTFSLLTLNQKTFFTAKNGTTAFLYDSGALEARMITRVLVVVFASLGILFEFQQIFRMRSRYLSLSNLIDWIVYVVAIGFVWDIPLDIKFDTCNSAQCWHWPAGAFLITLSWLNVLGYLKFFPFFGIFVIMFFDILNTLVKVSVLLALFLAAFSLGFNILLVEKDAFDTFGWSYLKSLVMATGEFEFEGIFIEDPLPFPAATIILFVMFVGIMGIILMNLLVGLAVDDIKECQDNAELKKLSAQVELVLEMEKSFPRSRKQNHIIEIDSSPAQFWKVKEVLSKSRIWELQQERTETDGDEEGGLADLRQEMVNMAAQLRLLRDEVANLKKDATGAEEE